MKVGPERLGELGADDTGVLIDEALDCVDVPEAKRRQRRRPRARERRERNERPIAPLQRRHRGHRVENATHLLRRGRIWLASGAGDGDVLVGKVEVVGIGEGNLGPKARLSC